MRTFMKKSRPYWYGVAMCVCAAALIWNSSPLLSGPIEGGGGPQEPGDTILDPNTPPDPIANIADWLWSEIHKDNGHSIVETISCVDPGPWPVSIHPDPNDPNGAARSILAHLIALARNGTAEHKYYLTPELDGLVSMWEAASPNTPEHRKDLWIELATTLARICTEASAFLPYYHDGQDYPSYYVQGWQGRDDDGPPDPQPANGNPWPEGIPDGPGEDEGQDDPPECWAGSFLDTVQGCAGLIRVARVILTADNGALPDGQVAQYRQDAVDIATFVKELFYDKYLTHQRGISNPFWAVLKNGTLDKDICYCKNPNSAPTPTEHEGWQDKWSITATVLAELEACRVALGPDETDPNANPLNFDPNGQPYDHQDLFIQKAHRIAERFKNKEFADNGIPCAGQMPPSTIWLRKTDLKDLYDPTQGTDPDNPWYYWISTSPDTAHCNREAIMMVTFHELGIRENLQDPEADLLFTASDLECMGNTASWHIWNGDELEPRFRDFIDGTLLDQNSPYYEDCSALGLGTWELGQIYHGWVRIGIYNSRMHDTGVNVLKALWCGQSAQYWDADCDGENEHPGNPSLTYMNIRWASIPLCGHLARNIALAGRTGLNLCTDCTPGWGCLD